MDTKSDEQFLVVQATIEANKQQDDEKQMKASEKQIKTDEKLTQITENLQVLTAFMMDQTNISKFSPSQKDTSTAPDPTTVVKSNRMAPSLEGGNSTKMCGMWTLKHEISSQKFYELLVNIELKGEPALDLRNFYNHIKMYLNAVTRLR